MGKSRIILRLLAELEADGDEAQDTLIIGLIEKLSGLTVETDGGRIEVTEGTIVATPEEDEPEADKAADGWVQDGHGGRVL